MSGLPTTFRKARKFLKTRAFNIVVFCLLVVALAGCAQTSFQVRGESRTTVGVGQGSN